MSFNYPVPESAIMREIEVKNSRFLAYLYPVQTPNEFKEALHDLKNQHPEARHHCWAYLIGKPGQTTLLSMSDDGEPSGTAGKPMLNVLQHSGIGDIGVIVVRYFGGTKLGTGGLVRAYSAAVQEVLEQCQTILKIEKTTVSFQLQYPQEAGIRFLLQSFSIDHEEWIYAEKILLHFQIPTSQYPEFAGKLKDLTSGEIQLKL